MSTPASAGWPPLTAFPVSPEQSKPETPQNESEELQLGIQQVEGIKRRISDYTQPQDMLRERIELLAKCESDNGENPEVKENGYIIDTNGKKSWGVLMFQEDTWKDFTKKFGLEHLDITNPQDQKYLAYRMLSYDERLYGRWKICSLRHGFL